MKVSLHPITPENFNECISLSVRDDQKYVASNIYSIAEAKVDPDMVIFAIYAGEEMVGFVSYAIDDNDKDLYINRMMIDKNFQGKGFAKETLNLLKQIVEKTPGIIKLTLQTHKNNSRAIQFYKMFGFVPTGITYGEEVGFELVVKNE